MLTLQKNYWLKLGHKGGVTQSSEKKMLILNKRWNMLTLHQKVD